MSRSASVLVGAAAIDRLDTDSDGDWTKRDPTFWVSG